MYEINKRKNINKDIKIKKGNSEISEFIKRPLPSDSDVEEFEDIISERSKENEISESLNEIYQDENGDIVDVSKLDIKKKRGLVYWVFSIIITVAIFAGAGYGFYYYIINSGSDAMAIDLEIKSEENILAGEEFFYEIDCHNSSRVKMTNVILELIYSENFIFLDSLPQSDRKNSVWNLNDIYAGKTTKIKVKGKIIDKKHSDSTLIAKITYTPENFSSEFKKEKIFTTIIQDIGINMNFEYPSSVLIGQENEINIVLNTEDDNFINKFRLIAESTKNVKVSNLEVVNIDKETPILFLEKVGGNVWDISGITSEQENIIIKYKINEKVVDQEEIFLRFEQMFSLPKEQHLQYENIEQETKNVDKYFVFFEEKIIVEVMKSDLNLTLLVNGSKNDKPIDFGEKLSYSIVYANKGETIMKDIVIMVVLSGDFLDWTTLEDNKNAKEKGNTLTWSKEEIPELEELDKNQEGIIDFSIYVKKFVEFDFDNNYIIKSYSQFNVKHSDDNDINESQAKDDIEKNDNRSNTIINKINSDLLLKQKVMYFNDDNIPVGSGPLPPKVGETTSYKVYWTVSNNLHELTDVNIEVKLPSYISWGDKGRTSVGGIRYEQDEHKVIWQIGRLPLSVYKVDGEFSINFIPSDSDRDKIMVLLPASIVKAIDNETKGNIERLASPKTTKLEDDSIAGINNDGMVQ